MSLQAIFFDAGGTLVFPTLERTLAPLTALGLWPSEEQLLAAERAAKTHLDRTWADKGQLAADYFDVYFSHLFRSLQCDNGELKPALAAGMRPAANWQRVRPGTLEFLLRLKRRFRLGLISNSDGKIRESFEAMGLAACFDCITDSGVVGHEKPAPEIFQAALASLDVAAQDSLYVGDVYCVDFLGATRVGMQAVLMDPAGVYRDSPHPRIESLPQLEQLLETE